MDAAFDNALRLVHLGFPAALGWLAARMGLVADARKAVGALNGYAIYFAFPALVVRGLLDATVALPTDAAFYLLWPITLGLVLIGLVGLTQHAVAPKRATLCLTAVFGNVAYLGLPYVEAVLGHDVAGPAALAVSVHVVGGVILGPVVLARWGRPDGARAVGPTWIRALRQPLFWAPLVGLLLRLSPLRNGASNLLSPLAGSAAPVALFLLGLYLYVERRQIVRPSQAMRAIWVHLAMRQLAIPLLALGLGLGAVILGLLPPTHARLHVVLAAMPVAITTFSMAVEAQAGTHQVAAAIVWSTLSALILLPLWTATAIWLLP